MEHPAKQIRFGWLLLLTLVVGPFMRRTTGVLETEYQLLGKKIAEQLMQAKKVQNVHYANQFAESFNELIRLYPHLFNDDAKHTDLAAQYVRALLPIDNLQLLDGYYAARQLMGKLPQAPNFKTEKSSCPRTCTTFGSCNEELKRCDCPRGRKGEACEERFKVNCNEFCSREDPTSKECFHLKPEHCVSGCNQRGICVSGFCHCFPGYFGADCSLSMDKDGKPELLAGLGYKVNTNPIWPKVYIHEVPPRMNVWRLLWLDRPVGMIIWERLLTGGHRVADPSQADYFYIPVFVRSCPVLAELEKYLKSSPAAPWLTRHNSSDHFITSTGDWGRCEHYESKNLPLFNQLIYLTHWGLKTNKSFPGRREDFLGGFKTCHYPNQDIVMPPINHEVITTWQSSPWYNPIPPAKPPPARTTLASFAGGICGWMNQADPPCEMTEYSLNVRASLYTLFHGKKDYVVEKRVPNIATMMLTSKFCFGPPGHGWGRRAAMAVVLGCVPVVIQDDVDQAFEPNLNWTDFGLRIAEKDMNFTDSILRGITDKHYKYMQSKLKCAAKHVFYTTAYGSLFGDDGFFDAFHTLLQLLMARKRNPGTPQANLTQVDPAFRDFMACSKTLHDDEKEPLCAFTTNKGLQDKRLCQQEVLVHALDIRKYPIGGAVCDRVDNPAQCRRF